MTNYLQIHLFFTEFPAWFGAIKREQDGIGMFCLCDALHGRYAIVEKSTRGGLRQHNISLLSTI